MRTLKGYEIKLLEEGNTYTFAHLLLELYPDECKDEGIDFRAVVNNYKAFSDFNNGVYTIYRKNGGKIFFNTAMQICGAKC